MNAIEVESLSKKYQLGSQNRIRSRTLREALSWRQKPIGVRDRLDLSNNTDGAFWALKDVTFSLREGERLAIIGGNGAGKSTLLKILSRITEPTQGRVTIRGKVSSLLEVGTGFHPELTGRENIYLNGAILGMKRREVHTKFDQIVAFSGVEKFIDTPVKHYSSGMYVRLAFSVSAWLDPDILIVDEVLSVGDHAFQRRCTDRMKELTGEGRTLIVVSHSMHAVKAMCETALLLDKGQVVSLGGVEEVTRQYLHAISPDQESAWHQNCFVPELSKAEYPTAEDMESIRCTQALFIDSEGSPTSILEITKKSKIKVAYEILKELTQDPVPHFHFYDEFGGRVFVSYPQTPSPRAPGRYVVECELPEYQLNTGRYTVTLIMSNFLGGLAYEHYFCHEVALRIEIVEYDGADTRRHGWGGSIPGVTRPRLAWQFFVA
jgi:lipopolysaccharide transport system ATP-binding protein